MFLAEVLKCKQKEETNRSNSWSEICVAKLLVFFSSGTLSWKQKSIALSFDSSKKNQFPSSFQRSRFCWIHSEGKFTVYYLGVCCSNNSCGTRSAIANKENFHLQFILGSPLKKNQTCDLLPCASFQEEKKIRQWIQSPCPGLVFVLTVCLPWVFEETK